MKKQPKKINQVAFAIESGIPMPPKNMQASGRKFKYPWFEMKVGDSFFVPNRTAAQFSGIKDYGQKATGFRFENRSVEGGARVWRVA